jgi:hypothetical protein
MHGIFSPGFPGQLESIYNTLRSPLGITIQSLTFKHDGIGAIPLRPTLCASVLRQERAGFMAYAPTEKIMRIFVREGPVRALTFRGRNICSLTSLIPSQMDIQPLPLPRKWDTYPSGISAMADVCYVCYIRWEVFTAAAYLHCNASGSPPATAH